MIDIDAIRERDRRWNPRGVRTEAPEQDRRALLDYIDEMELLAQEIQIELTVLRARVGAALSPGLPSDDSGTVEP